MSVPNEPIASSVVHEESTGPTGAIELPRERGGRVIALAGVVALVGMGMWAWRPLRAEPRDAQRASSDMVRAESDATKTSSQASPPLDLSAFRAPIWVAPPPPPPSPSVLATNTPTPPPPPPFTAQLLAIAKVKDIKEGAGAPIWEAILYDPGQDRVVHARAGDVVLQRCIRSVNANEVVITESATATAKPDGDRTLRLREPVPVIPGLLRTGGKMDGAGTTPSAANRASGRMSGGAP